MKAIIDYIKQTNVKDGKYVLPAHLTIERKEEFKYERIEAMVNGKEVIYPAAL